MLGTFCFNHVCVSVQFYTVCRSIIQLQCPQWNFEASQKVKETFTFLLFIGMFKSLLLLDKVWYFGLSGKEKYGGRRNVPHLILLFRCCLLALWHSAFLPCHPQPTVRKIKGTVASSIFNFKEYVSKDTEKHSEFKPTSDNIPNITRGLWESCA